MNTDDLKGKDNRGEKQSAIILKDANDWMQEGEKLPPFRRLLGDLWIDGEISILFASSGVGKTLFAVQVADNLTRGENTEGLINDHKEPIKVAYLDFELTLRQFSGRYVSDEHGSYKFNSGYFFRAEFNPDADLDKDFNSSLTISRISWILETGTLKFISLEGSP